MLLENSFFDEIKKSVKEIGEAKEEKEAFVKNMEQELKGDYLDKAESKMIKFFDDILSISENIKMRIKINLNDYNCLHNKNKGNTNLEINFDEKYVIINNSKGSYLLSSLAERDVKDIYIHKHKIYLDDYYQSVIPNNLVINKSENKSELDTFKVDMYEVIASFLKNKSHIENKICLEIEKYREDKVDFYKEEISVGLKIKKDILDYISR